MLNLFVYCTFYRLYVSLVRNQHRDTRSFPKLSLVLCTNFGLLVRSKHIWISPLAIAGHGVSAAKVDCWTRAAVQVEKQASEAIEVFF